MDSEHKFTTESLARHRHQDHKDPPEHVFLSRVSFLTPVISFTVSQFEVRYDPLNHIQAPRLVFTRAPSFALAAGFD